MQYLNDPKNVEQIKQLLAQSNEQAQALARALPKDEARSLSESEKKQLDKLLHGDEEGIKAWYQIQDNPTEIAKYWIARQVEKQDLQALKKVAKIISRSHWDAGGLFEKIIEQNAYDLFKACLSQRMIFNWGLMKEKHYKLIETVVSDYKSFVKSSIESMSDLVEKDKQAYFFKHGYGLDFAYPRQHGMYMNEGGMFIVEVNEKEQVSERVVPKKGDLTNKQLNWFEFEQLYWNSIGKLCIDEAIEKKIKDDWIELINQELGKYFYNPKRLRQSGEPEITKKHGFQHSTKIEQKIKGSDFKVSKLEDLKKYLNHLPQSVLDENSYGIWGHVQKLMQQQPVDKQIGWLLELLKDPLVTERLKNTDVLGSIFSLAQKTLIQQVNYASKVKGGEKKEIMDYLLAGGRFAYNGNMTLSEAHQLSNFLSKYSQSERGLQSLISLAINIELNTESLQKRFLENPQAAGLLIDRFNIALDQLNEKGESLMHQMVNQLINYNGNNKELEALILRMAKKYPEHVFYGKNAENKTPIEIINQSKYLEKLKAKISPLETKYLLKDTLKNKKDSKKILSL